MEETAEYYFEKAKQCRRLIRAINDDRAIEGLTAMAEEFEAKGKAAQAVARTQELLGDGKPGRLVRGDNQD